MKNAAKKITTDLQIKRLTKTGNYNVGNGVYLCIAKTGTKSFKFRYGFDGQDRWEGIGPYKTGGLKEARDTGYARRSEYKKLIKKGIDPREHNRQAIEEQRAADDLHKA
ncbi:MAG: DUF4102 domain-containing protein, partial [Gammaproteobacteria bacterium]|nr:DUF4102 domain-containing protein [Gammaproteobacteria bacterium]